MTREEREAAISTLEYIKEYCHYEYEKDVIDKAREELEQESVFDKIRAEIERLHYHPKLDFIKNDEVVDMALEIIDKYRAEQEGE